MKINTTARHCELDPEVRTFVHQRLERLLRYFRDPRGTTPRLHTKYRDMERAETPWETGRRESTRRKHTGVNHLAPITKYSRFFGAGKPAAWKN